MLLLGMHPGTAMTAVTKNSVEVPQKNKNQNYHMIQQSQHKGNDKSTLKRYLHCHIHYSSIHNIPKLETTVVSSNR